MEGNLYAKGAIITYEDGTSSAVRAKISNVILVNQVPKSHVVVEGQRLDQISYKYYGSNKFWWIIADVNDIADNLINPFSDLVPGTKLIIPSINANPNLFS